MNTTEREELTIVITRIGWWRHRISVRRGLYESFYLRYGRGRAVAFAARQARPHVVYYRASRSARGVSI